LVKRLTLSSAHCFRFECEMLSGIKSALPVLLGLSSRREFSYLCETGIGNVIPDLVAGVFCDEIEPTKTFISNVEAHIVALVAQCGDLSETEVRARLHLSEPGANRALSRLRKSGIIRFDHGGNVALAHGAWLKGIQVTAFELKLRRWTEALEQAVSYLNFADRAYVVLDGAQVSPTERMLEMFREKSVGLLLQRGDSFQELCEARKLTCLTADKVIVAQKLRHAGIPSLACAVQCPA